MSKESFMKTMRNHPERLPKGVTAEQAYQGMRRQVRYNEWAKAAKDAPSALAKANRPTLVGAARQRLNKLNNVTVGDITKTFGKPFVKYHPVTTFARIGSKAANNKVNQYKKSASNLGKAYTVVKKDWDSYGPNSKRGPR